jgi:hypothetical protein
MSAELDRTSENSDRDDFWTVNAGETQTLGQVLNRARLRIVTARDAAAGLSSPRGEGVRQVLNDALEDLDNVVDALSAEGVLEWHPDAAAGLRLVVPGCQPMPRGFKPPHRNESADPKAGVR